MPDSNPDTPISLLRLVREYVLVKVEGEGLRGHHTDLLDRIDVVLGMGNASPSDPCLSKHLPDEPMFVLLARDPQAPALVMRWADNRERLEGSSQKTANARRIATDMRAWKDAHPDVGLPPIHPARDLGKEWRTMVADRVMDRAEKEIGGAVLTEELVGLILDELVGPLPAGWIDTTPSHPVTTLGLIERLCKVPTIVDEYAYTTRTILEGLAFLRDAALRHEPLPVDAAAGSLTVISRISPERMRVIASECGAKTDRTASEVLATTLCREVAAQIAGGRRMAIDLEGVFEDGASIGSFRVTIEPLSTTAAGEG